MSKREHIETSTSSRSTLILLAIGGVLVLALVGWALSRSIAPQPIAVASDATPTAGAASADPGTNNPATSSASTPAELGQRSDEEKAKAALDRVTPDQLKQMVDAGNVTIIDVRDAESFGVSHIAGALHIPLSRIEGEIGYLPKGKPIVAYCT